MRWEEAMIGRGFLGDDEMVAMYWGNESVGMEMLRMDKGVRMC